MAFLGAYNCVSMLDPASRSRKPGVDAAETFDVQRDVLQSPTTLQHLPLLQGPQQ